MCISTQRKKGYYKIYIPYFENILKNRKIICKRIRAYNFSVSSQVHSIFFARASIARIYIPYKNRKSNNYHQNISEVQCVTFLQ